VHAARGHALVRRLNHHRDAARLQHLQDRVGDLRRQLLLDLEALRISLHHPRQLADADDAAMRQVGDMRAAGNRHHVVLAMALQPDVAQQDDFVVAVGFLEGAFQQRHRVDGIAFIELLVRPHHACRRVEQAFARGIVPGPAQQGADSFFGFLPRRAVLGGDAVRCGTAGLWRDDIHRLAPLWTLLCHR